MIYIYIYRERERSNLYIYHVYFYHVHVVQQYSYKINIQVETFSIGTSHLAGRTIFSLQLPVGLYAQDKYTHNFFYHLHFKE